MENYDKDVRDFISSRTRLKFDSSVHIDDLIIKKSADRELAADMDRLYESIKSALESFAKSSLRPKLQFTNVKEAGFRIWGKRDNIAISKFTMSQILGELGNISDPEKLDGALHAAGSRSAFQFFQDFLPLLADERRLLIPETEIEFLNTLATFDLRSSWWTRPPQITQSARFLSIVLHQPFTAFPWHEGNPYNFNRFVASYFAALYNCAADFLRVVDRIRGANHKSAFCVRAVDLEQAPAERLYLRLYISTKYVNDWDDIDTVFFKTWQDHLNDGTQQETDLLQFYDYYGHLVSSLKGLFGNSLEFKQDWDAEMDRRRKQQPPRGLEITASSILLDLRYKYQELRTMRLLELDDDLRNMIDHSHDPVD